MSCARFFVTVVDLGERLARGVGELRALDHALRRFLHGRHRVLRVRLNRLHDRADLLRRLAGAFREPLHLLRDHREAAPRLAGRRRLDGGVQREHVRLLRDVRDQLHDLADLLRGFAQALDPLRRLLDLLADVVHARDRVLHRERGPCRRPRASAAPPGRPPPRWTTPRRSSATPAAPARSSPRSPSTAAPRRRGAPRRSTAPAPSSASPRWPRCSRPSPGCAARRSCSSSSPRWRP